MDEPLLVKQLIAQQNAQSVWVVVFIVSTACWSHFICLALEDPG